jgi:hypothetical protein
VYFLIIARQRLGKQVPLAKNIQATIELLDKPFSMVSASYQRKVGDKFFPELLA